MTSSPEIIRIRDAARTIEFEGTMLSDVSTETDSNPRWTEMELYLTVDGRYVLTIIGRSVVYHDSAGRCNSGVPTPVGEIDPELRDELEPCPRCNPPGPDDLAGTVTIDLEEDRHVVHVCATAADVVRKLRNPKSSSSSISGPGQRLLAIAARCDDGIMAATTTVDQL